MASIISKTGLWQFPLSAGEIPSGIFFKWEMFVQNTMKKAPRSASGGH
jgi:hypothetical protein